MVLLYTFLVMSICFGALLYAGHIWHLNQARRSGLYPDKGKATMFDVRRLLLKKEKHLAIRVYCEIFKTGYRQAQKAVDELERSILEKNIEK